MGEANTIMLEAASKASNQAQAPAIIIFVDALEDWSPWKNSAEKKKFILVTQKQETWEELLTCKKELKAAVLLPPVNLTRVNQVKLSVIMAITEGVIKPSDRVVCLSGIPASGSLDTMIVLDLEKETEFFTASGISHDLLRKVRPEVLETVLRLALELSTEGREGKAIGTTFVIGDHEKVLRLSRPLILNPFKGYPEEMRNILDFAVHETVKEFSLLDGAFIIKDDGVIMAAGVHLDAALSGDGLMPGLGCRHMAAAGITDVTDAASVTISGSTGVVRVFSRGKTLLEVEKPFHAKGEARE